MVVTELGNGVHGVTICILAGGCSEDEHSLCGNIHAL